MKAGRTLRGVPTLLMLVLASPAAAQTAVSGETDAATSAARGPLLGSPLLPADHWAVRAVERADALGLIPGHLPSQRLISRYAAGLALWRAAESTTNPWAAPRARGWYERFLEEFPDFGERVAGGDRAGLALQGGSVSAGYLDHSGVAAPGLGWWDGERTGALPRADESGATATARIALGIGRLAAEAAPSYTPGADLRLGAGEAVGVLGSWRVSVGREPAGYETARGGGTVLSVAETFDRLEVATERPVRLPGWFRGLGQVSFHTFLTRMPDVRHPGRPYFWGARGALQPHPRFTLAVQRAALFGGDGSPEKVTLENIARMLIGGVGGLAFEDQIVSISGRLRLPTEEVIPVTLYLESGAGDGAGAWLDVPGRVMGVMTPGLPGLPEVEMGIEYATFAHSCCSNPSWYRHGSFLGSWSGVREPMGHPLGGEGSEVLLYSTASLLEGRLRLEGRSAFRERKGENLFVPGRDGRSTALSASAVWRVLPGADLDLELARESGEGWSEERLQALVRVFFGGGS